MADIFDLISEKVTFVESEADPIFEENFTDAFKVNKDCFKVYKEYKNVINIGAADRHTIRFIEVNVSVSATETVLLRKGIDIAQRLSKKQVRLLIKNEHYGRLESWCICWDGGHDTEAVLFYIWVREGYIFFINIAHLNLMVTLAVIKADDINCIRSRTDADDYIITTGYWKFKRFRDIVRFTIGYAHIPYKFVNIGNILLVGLC